MIWIFYYFRYLILNHYQNGFRSYSDINEFLSYADRLISDVNFRASEGKKLQDGLISPEKFAKEFKKVLNTHMSAWVVGHDEIAYEKFFERYIDLENNNGYASTEKLVRILKKDVFRICRFRVLYSMIFFRLVILRIPIFRHNS